MSMHTQLLRGLFALPVAALLIVVGLIAPPQPAVLPGDVETAEAASPAELPRTVDFNAMLPGALHVVKPAKLAEG